MLEAGCYFVSRVESTNGLQIQTNRPIVRTAADTFTFYILCLDWLRNSMDPALMII